MSPSGTKCSNIWAKGGHPIVKPYHCSPSDISGLTYTGFLWVSIWKWWLPGYKETFSRGFRTCCRDSNYTGITQQRWRCTTEICRCLLKRTRPPLENSKGDDQGNRLERFLRTLVCVANLDSGKKDKWQAIPLDGWEEHGCTADTTAYWTGRQQLHICEWDCWLPFLTKAVTLISSDYSMKAHDEKLHEAFVIWFSALFWFLVDKIILPLYLRCLLLIVIVDLHCQVYWFRIT